MKLETYTPQEVMDMPINQLKQMNELWRTAIKKYWELWTYELLKRNPRDFDDFLLDQEELKDLHFQFKWENMDWKQRLIIKNPMAKHQDYQYNYETQETVYVKDFWDGSEYYEN